MTVVQEKSTENNSSATTKPFTDLAIKVIKGLGFSSVKSGKEQGMKTLQARNQLRSFHF